MTWDDLVKKYFPDADDQERDFILWETTAFPFAPVEHIEKQLQDNQTMWFAEKRSNFKND